MQAQGAAKGMLALEFQGMQNEDITSRAQELVAATLELAGYELVKRGRTDVGESVFIMIVELETWFDDLKRREAAHLE
jgi:hypothetical protein